MICRNDISNLKTDINDKIGQKIIVKGSLGRSKEFAKAKIWQRGRFGKETFRIDKTNSRPNIQCYRKGGSREELFGCV